MDTQRKQITMGVLFSFISVFINMLIGIVYTPLLLNKLGQSQYGIYSLCISVVGYLTIINGGANAAYVRYYVQGKNGNKSIKLINGIFFKIFFILSIIAFIIGTVITLNATFIFGSKIQSDEYTIVKRCFGLLTIIVTIEIFTSFYSSLLVANEKFIYVKGIVILTAVLKPLLTIPFLLNGYNCIIILIVRLIISSLVLFFNIFYCYKTIGIPIELKAYERILYFDIFQFMFFIVLQSIFDQLNWQIDKFILARVSGTSAVSLYSVGSLLNTYFVTIASAVTTVFIAEVNRNVDYKEKVNAILLKTSKIIAYIVFTIMALFIFIGDKFIILWAGAEYYNSFFVGLLLMFPLTVALPLGVGLDIARAKNKHQKQIVYNLLVCIINFFISIPLAIKFGAIGSAFGTFISEVVICWIIEPIYYKRVLELDVGRIYRALFVLLPSLLPGIVYMIIMRRLGFIVASWIQIIFHTSIFIFMTFTCFFMFSFSKDEKNKILRMIGVIRCTLLTL